MSFLIDLIESIVNVFGILINLVINTITSLISLITNIPNYLNFIFDSVNVIPSFILPFVTAYVSLVVVQYILNRKVD